MHSAQTGYVVGTKISSLGHQGAAWRQARAGFTVAKRWLALQVVSQIASSAAYLLHRIERQMWIRWINILITTILAKGYTIPLRPNKSQGLSERNVSEVKRPLAARLIS